MTETKRVYMDFVKVPKRQPSSAPKQAAKPTSQAPQTAQVPVRSGASSTPGIVMEKQVVTTTILSGTKNPSIRKVPAPQAPVVRSARPVQRPATHPASAPRPTPPKSPQATSVSTPKEAEAPELEIIDLTNGRGFAKLGARSPFLKSVSVEKRPLSHEIKKNVYKKSTPPAPITEQPAAPVTIIKQEKEKKSTFGLVVVIIVSIILGAATGTAAFFLLPH